MEASFFLIFFHLVGFGLIMTLLVAGWLLHKQYKQANDYKTKLVILTTARMVGLMSPIAILLMSVTGIGNMHVRGLGFFTESSELWLNIKVVLFAIAAVNGIIFGIRSKKRGMLVSQLAQGTAPADGEKQLAVMDHTALAFYILQTVLVTSILVLTVWKHGRFGA